MAECLENDWRLLGPAGFAMTRQSELLPSFLPSMIKDDLFSPEQLEAIEARLWATIGKLSSLDSDLPPLDSMLGATPTCNSYSASLVSYADAFPHPASTTWQDHPLLEHLSACPQCRDTLAQLRAVRRSAPRTHSRHSRPAPGIDLTLFDGEMPRPDPSVRSALDPRRPVLLYSGFLDQPSGWHFVLESEPQIDEPEPDLVLTLTPPSGSGADVEVTLVTYGQVLHAVTDEDGRARFSHLLVPAAASLETPVLSLHLHTPVLAAT